MDKNGFLDIGLVSFVFTPLAFTVALVLLMLWSRVKKSGESGASRGSLDTPGLLLTAAARRMPEEQREWGAAMIRELGQVQGMFARWWFALGCVRVALFPPRRSELRTGALTGRNPVCGMLAVALPPLGLPLLYLAALISEALLKQKGLSISEGYPGLGRGLILFSLSCVLAGMPLGLAGLLRRERLRKLSVMGLISPVCIISYFLIVMSFVAGGPNGD
jgi:hypothetical protein